MDSRGIAGGGGGGGQVGSPLSTRLRTAPHRSIAFRTVRLRIPVDMPAIFRAVAATACVVVLLSLAVAEPSPEPARVVPKVYNALITSNQNLEPSKAFPVYQPVIRDTFAYPFAPPLYYPGDFPNIYHYPSQRPLGPPPQQQQPPLQFPQQSPPQYPQQLPPHFPQQPGQYPQQPQGQYPQQPQGQYPQQPPAEFPQQPASPPQTNRNPEDKTPPQESQPLEQPDLKSESSPTSAPPPPPKTESPIPLNQFGLPPQVQPLGRVGPPFEGFTPLAPFPYSYPGFRFYDPYDPFPGSPYLNLPQLYRPFPNYLGQNSVLTPQEAKPEDKSETNSNSPQSPPSSPAANDDSILNYPSKDPSIPNVPPPPLTEGGSGSATTSEEKSD